MLSITKGPSKKMLKDCFSNPEKFIYSQAELSDENRPQPDAREEQRKFERIERLLALYEKNEELLSCLDLKK